MEKPSTRIYIRADGTIDPYDVATITVESDPHGTDQHTPGAHLDSGKPQIMRGALYSFPHALEAIAVLTEIGAAKYAYDSWKSVPDGATRYRDSAGRHDVALAKGEQYDPQSGIHHLIAVCWDRLAELELRLRAGEISITQQEHTQHD